MKFCFTSILILVMWLEAAQAADNKVVETNERSMTCNDLLSEVSSLSTSIKIHKLAISWNARDRKKAKTVKQKEDLDQSTSKHIEKKESDYNALASIISIYQALHCEERPLVHELYCPRGWSEECR